jgi:hypothetical protein
MITRYDRFHINHGPDRATASRLVLDLCRALRAHEGCHGARYYWATVNDIAILSDWETAAAAFTPPAVPNPEIGEIQYKLYDIADLTARELWTDARQGRDSYARAGRA